MIDRNFLNKNDTVIFKNDEVLGGVFDFDIKMTASGEGLYEMLSCEPWEIINKTDSCVITLKMYSADFIEENGEVFTLVFACGDKKKTFEGCKTVGTQIYTDDKGRVVTVHQISAERMC